MEFYELLGLDVPGGGLLKVPLAQDFCAGFK